MTLATLPAPQSKPFWQSTTFWGIIISVLGQVFAGFEATGQVPAGTGVDVGALIGHVVSGVGLLVAIIGRFRAKGPITLK